MSMSTVAFIAGTLFVLIAVVGGGLNIKEINVPAIRMVERISLGVIGIVFISYGILASFLAGSGVGAGSQTPAASQTQRSSDSSRPDVPPGTAQPHLTFTIPSESSRVVLHQEVKGTVFDISPDQHLWLVVQAKNQNFYPQGEIIPDVNGRFSSYSYFGDHETKSGEKFHLIAVVTSRKVSDSFMNYLKMENNSGLPGLPPDGVQIVSNIEVTRQ